MSLSPLQSGQTGAPQATRAARARYVMIGGFLGAGKTTLVGKLAQHLADRGTRVGLITNDQSHGLVDSTILRNQGFAVEEIAGGCFCCRFDSLEGAVEKLTDDTRPEVFLAEPVGSCTDLLATVSYPLRRIYGDRFAIAPLTVVVDPARAARILGVAEGKSFSSKVTYVYEKQLEEARLILVNKIETIDDELRGKLVRALEERFPRAEVMCVSAKRGDGLEAWYERALSEAADFGPTLDIDYDLYAEGEALLGWLNCTVRIEASEPFNANALVLSLAADIQAHLVAADIEVAHLKLTLDPGLEDGQLAVLSIVGSDREPDVREALFDAVDDGSLIVNLRAEASPEVLERAFEEALAQHTASLRLTIEHREAFRPARPVPLYREGASG